ncbi:hypothetical protein B0H67DRAFT_648896 [Lasiosphaeris hirsuta]|uniref:Uncharacterized protein n=1 Tax=Lasiosphaeris hirsuta TaxID=260670 RepID=A0AA39ZVG1_9PEZI|nr:hypothetical protein B0H67DRAFT_648896 [Lasiosphaeris hirsuta]
MSGKGSPLALKRFVRECPERLRADCPGAVLLLLVALENETVDQTLRLTLHHFTNLSGDQVVQLVGAVVASDTEIKLELIIWDNPGLPVEELRIRGPDAILHGEYTAVFLQEPDLYRLRYGLVTRDAQGRLEVWDAAGMADAAGDADSRLA